MFPSWQPEDFAGYDQWTFHCVMLRLQKMGDLRALLIKYIGVSGHRRIMILHSWSMLQRTAVLSFTRSWITLDVGNSRVTPFFRLSMSNLGYWKFQAHSLGTTPLGWLNTNTSAWDVLWQQTPLGLKINFESVLLCQLLKTKKSVWCAWLRVTPLVRGTSHSGNFPGTHPNSPWVPPHTHAPPPLLGTPQSFSSHSPVLPPARCAQLSVIRDYPLHVEGTWLNWHLFHLGISARFNRIGQNALKHRWIYVATHHLIISWMTVASV